MLPTLRRGLRTGVQLAEHVFQHAAAGAHWGGVAVALLEPAANKGVRKLSGAPTTWDAFPLERIRNFSIIAHIDHGKSTLADRLIELGGASRVKQVQLLDQLQVERDRGITVKANSASLVYNHNNEQYLLNLVDTPGHVDFSYEVSRSLAACQGALLLVDATQGIQAQTVANFYLAYELDLTVLPVINKIDMPAADPDRVAAEVEAAFDLAATTATRTSAKAGIGIQDVLAAVIENVPAPAGEVAGPLRLLLFDAYMDDFRGAICMVLVKDGVVRKGDKVKAFSSGAVYEVHELGVTTPEMQQTAKLVTGQVGYIIAGLKSAAAVRVGDTWHAPDAPVEPLPGFRDAKPMMFAGVYPQSQDGFERLNSAVTQLSLNDPSVTVQRESSNALGAGFRCGFLGMLHMDVFMQRLAQEHGEAVLTTTPMAPFRLRYSDGSSRDFESPLQFPQDRTFEEVLEPTVTSSIIVPEKFTGAVLQLCTSRRGDLLEHTYLTSDRCLLRYQLPLGELAGSFYNSLKSITSGYATFDYEVGEYKAADLVRLDFLVHGAPADALTRVVHRADSQAVARAVCKKLAGVVDRQAFEVAIQAAVGGKVICRETVRATRKDVLAKCYGGDITRKKKLLEKQKEGKKKMRRLGAVSLAPEEFHEVMTTTH